MALTKDDLNQIRVIFNEGIETLVLPRFDALESDVTTLKVDVGTLKEDVAVLKDDVTTLKEDVSVLKIDVSELKTEMREVKTDIRQMKQHLGSIDGRVEALENDIRDIYSMMKKNENSIDVVFSKQSLEQKLFRLNKELLQTAKQAGVTLPR
ncbi:hypothetical protein KA021_00640 [Candidatus Saccharibacteria bacterium]|jgi:chromosome segregation ATPase|nr:hypothetical protein [Candidatus Saccharibacteria bacterium]